MSFLRLMVVLVFVAKAATGRAWLADEFDARKLTYEEKRIVQAALALSGDYVGLLDGSWGTGSQRSLEVWSAREAGTVKPEFRHLKPLLNAFQDEMVASGWQTFNIESTNTSYAAPFGILVQKDGDVLRWDSPDGGLSVIAEFSELNASLALHAYVLSLAAPGTEPYQSLRDTRLTTSVEMGAGMTSYLRSDVSGGGWFTLSIIANDVHRNRIKLIASSMQRGSAPPMQIPAGGLLSLIVAETSPATSTSSNQPTPSPESAGQGSGDSTGTGFYVNNTDLVTAAHVVSECAILELTDGTVLSVISKSVALDLAVLSSTKRAESWLVVSAGSAAVLGEQVTALGYPYLGTLQQGLTVTGGNVSALAGLDGSNDRIMFSAPVQPGNSGGPLLNATGQVIGVVVARTDDLAVLGATGTLPQNMNFAVPPGALAGFLNDARVVLSVAKSTGFDVSAGIPDSVAKAVVPVFCKS